MTLVQYFVCCITHSFQLWRNVWHSIEQRTMTHPLTSGIHDSKTRIAYVPKANNKHMTEIRLCIYCKGVKSCLYTFE